MEKLLRDPPNHQIEERKVALAIRERGAAVMCDLVVERGGEAGNAMWRQGCRLVIVQQ
jgi:hypothetical protein